MSALQFIEDLWSPPEPPNSPPQRQFVAGTLGGVTSARDDFARMYLYDNSGREGVKQKFLERHEQRREGARITFLSEFLYLGDIIKEGLIIGIVGKGGHVTSLYHSKHGERAQSLTREAARELFAKGTTAVSIDEHGRRAVTAIGWNLGQLTLANVPAVAAPASTAPPPPREARGAAQFIQWGHAAKEDAALVAKARSAIVNGRWGPLPRPS